MQSVELKSLGPCTLADFSISGIEHSIFPWRAKVVSFGVYS